MVKETDIPANDTGNSGAIISVILVVLQIAKIKQQELKK